MVILTTFLAPPLLRWAFKGDEEAIEQADLAES
jgi:hypothetical protein